MTRPIRFVLLLALMLPRPAWAQVKVDLELILMADASGSIDDGEFVLQRHGYALALRDPRVIDAILYGPLGQIALAYVEWSGPSYKAPIVPWTLIRSGADLTAFALELEEAPREIYFGGTALGDAILYGIASLQANSFDGRRRIIDLSADGGDKDGLPAAVGRDQAVEHGIAVNGLPILEDYPGLDEFFRDNVIGGPGAFYSPANTFGDFNIAVRKKLIREIAGESSAPVGRTAATSGRNVLTPSRFQ